MAMAAQKGTPEYEQMKELKKKQREERPKQQPADSKPSKSDLFWKSEGERSGFSGVGSGIGNSIHGFFESLGKMEMPKGRAKKKAA